MSSCDRLQRQGQHHTQLTCGQHGHRPQERPGAAPTTAVAAGVDVPAPAPLEARPTALCLSPCVERLPRKRTGPLTWCAVRQGSSRMESPNTEKQRSIGRKAAPSKERRRKRNPKDRIFTGIPRGLLVELDQRDDEFEVVYAYAFSGYEWECSDDNGR